MKTSENDIAYFVATNSIKLSIKEIDTLFENRTRNENTIAKSHLPLVLAMANSFYNTTGVSFNELFSSGLLGLTNAIQTYNPTNKATFTTYAKTCIVNQINQLVKSPIDEVIRPPFTNRRNVTVPSAYIFSRWLTYESEDTVEFTVEDKIRNEVEDLYQDYNNTELELIKIIKQEIQIEKHQDIIIKFFGLGMVEPMKQFELAQEYNTSPQNISDIFRKVITKLKKNEKFKTKLKQLYNN